MAIKSEQVLKKLNNGILIKHGIRCVINKLDYDFPLHRHNYVEIECIKKGKLEHELNGVKTECGVGDCFCLHTSDLHKIRIIEPLELYNVGINCLFAPRAVRNMINSVKFPMTGHLDEEELKQFSQWFECLSKIINSEEAFEQEKITAYCILMLSFVFERSKDAGRDMATGYYYVGNAMEYVANHYMENITIDSVAAELFISTGHLSRLFTKINGILRIQVIPIKNNKSTTIFILF